MGKVMGMSAVAFAAAAALAAWVCFGAAMSRGVTWADLDADGDGTTTLAEAFGAGDIGVREVWRDGRACREVFALKDGMPVRLRCGDAPRHAG